MKNELIQAIYFKGYTRNMLSVRRKKKICRQDVYTVMAPGKIKHSEHLSKCYFIFSILSTSINFIKKEKKLTFSCLLRSYLFKDSRRCTSIVHTKGNTSC